MVFALRISYEKQTTSWTKLPTLNTSHEECLFSFYPVSSLRWGCLCNGVQLTSWTRFLANQIRRSPPNLDLSLRVVVFRTVTKPFFKGLSNNVLVVWFIVFLTLFLRNFVFIQLWTELCLCFFLDLAAFWQSNRISWHDLAFYSQGTGPFTMRSC